jgi:hypothetical protein
MPDTREIDTTTPPSEDFKAECYTISGSMFASVSVADAERDKEAFDNICIKTCGDLDTDNRVHVVFQNNAETARFMLFKVENNYLLSINDRVIPLKQFLDIQWVAVNYLKGKKTGKIPKTTGIRCMISPDADFIVTVPSVSIVTRALMYFSETYGHLIRPQNVEAETPRRWF